MATIEIDGKSYEAEPGQKIIEIADANGIEIPRFCYHKKLSVSANCRMCLVEVEKAPKPLPACATPVMDGMKVFTRSPRALAAQKAVMEFLLINHPLDCPICDQGGECELQDVSVGYGKDKSKYQEEKRVVFDKNIGPLISTEMTRCIHCMRCVRFGMEIAGIQEMGATGRGEHTRVGMYVEKNLTSEMSGNVVDLCPVGALTAKPSRFKARAWELIERDGIAPHDCVGSNVHFHIRRNQLIRVVPKEHEAINEVWLSDRDRFSYQGLNAEDRLMQPMIKKDGEWQTTDWQTALTFAVEGLKKQDAKDIGGLVSPNSTSEELYLFQKVLRGIGSANIDHRLRQVDFSDQDKAPLYPYLGQPIEYLETNDVTLVIGSHIRKEQPLINHRLRKSVLNGGKVLVVNPVDYEFNYEIADKIIVAPTAMVNALAGIAKALGGKLPNGMDKLLASVSPTAAQKKIAEQLKAGQKTTVLIGNLAESHPQFATIRALAATITELSPHGTLGHLAEAANSAGACLAGTLPHRTVAGEVSETTGKHAYDMLNNGMKAYVLLGIEPELDSCANALDNLQKADFVVSLTAYRTENIESYADVMLPIALFAETSGAYVNCEGRWQHFTGAVAPAGEARPAWKILRVMGNLLDLDGFDYESSEDVRDELEQQIGDKRVDNTHAWQAPSDLNGFAVAGMQRITEMPIYAGDALVRRAKSLQATKDAQIATGVHINAQAASKIGLNGQANVKQGEFSIVLPVVVDERVPDDCMLVYAGQKDNVSLGQWYGQVEVSAV